MNWKDINTNYPEAFAKYIDWLKATNPFPTFTAEYARETPFNINCIGFIIGENCDWYSDADFPLLRRSMYDFFSDYDINVFIEHHFVSDVRFNYQPFIAYNDDVDTVKFDSLPSRRLAEELAFTVSFEILQFGFLQVEEDEDDSE